MSQSEKKTRAAAPVLLALVVVVAVFATGFVAGIVGDRAHLLREGRILPKEGMRFASARVVRVMDRELDLSDEQRVKIENILSRREVRIDAVWAELRPKVREEIDGSNREIADVLNAEQRKGFELVLERWERHSRKLLGREYP